MHGSVQFMHIISRYFQIFPESGCTICMVHASGKYGDGSPPRATGSRSQAPRRADQDTGGRGMVSGTGGIGSCQGSGRSRSGNENNLTTPIPLPPPVFFKAEHPAVELRGISVWLCFVSCDTSFFHMDLFFARSFILSPRFFICRAIFPAKFRSRYRAWTWALVGFGSSREERVKG